LRSHLIPRPFNQVCRRAVPKLLGRGKSLFKDADKIAARLNEQKRG